MSTGFSAASASPPDVTSMPYTKGVHEVATNTFAWLAPHGEWGRSNAGLIAGDGAALLVDTLFDLALTREMLEGFAPVTATAPITCAVNTHADGDHAFGNHLLAPDVPIYASTQTGTDTHAVPPQALAALQRADLGPEITPFFRERFSHFHFDDVRLRKPDHLLDDQLTLHIGGRRVDLHRLGPAHTEGDVVVHVPDAGVLYAGDLLFIGITPVMWSGPIAGWIAACDRMLSFDAQVVVPGHGPVTDNTGIRGLRDYLSYLDEKIGEAYARGIPPRMAAFDIDLGPYASLPDPERVVPIVYAAYHHLDPTMPRVEVSTLIADMANWRTERLS